MCLAYAKKSLMLCKKIIKKLIKRNHATYKNAEKKAVELRKKKDYKNSSIWFSIAARLRKHHTIMYFDGIFDEGHKKFYNFMLRASEKDKIKANNIEKNKQKKT